jgi:hypothetical protein
LPAPNPRRGYVGIKLSRLCGDFQVSGIYTRGLEVRSVGPLHQSLDTQGTSHLPGFLLIVQDDGGGAKYDLQIIGVATGPPRPCCQVLASHLHRPGVEADLQQHTISDLPGRLDGPGTVGSNEYTWDVGIAVSHPAGGTAKGNVLTRQ